MLVHPTLGTRLERGGSVRSRLGSDAREVQGDDDDRGYDRDQLSSM